MNIKAEAFKKIAENIKKQYDDICYKIYQNKYTFKKLTNEQTILKRERSELMELYNYCVGRKKIEES